MEKENKSFVKKLWGHFIRRIITGVVIIVPAGLTFIILKWFFQGVDGILSPHVTALIKRYFPYVHGLIVSNIGLNEEGVIPAVGFVLMIILVYIIGLFSTNFLGRKIIMFLNNLAMKIPVVNWLYKTIKQVVDTVTGAQMNAFKKVVLVDLLGSGIRVLGLVSGHSYDKSGNKYIHVFVPTSPNPTSGYLELLRSDQIVETSLSVEDAIKMILSGGVIAPEVIE